MLKVLSIVPARAGSKRLPKKNIKPLAGKPLILYTFDAIKESDLINHTIVTSDCPIVLSLAEEYDNTTLIKRPTELASDTASSLDVIKHALEHADELGINYDVICLLQPTTPLRTSSDIDNAIRHYLSKDAKGVVSMTECAHSPLWSTQLETDNDFKSFISGLTNTRSQDLAPFYQLNGAIYLVDKFVFKKEGKLFLNHDYYPFIMDSENSIDIDNEIDFIVASAVLSKRNS